MNKNKTNHHYNDENDHNGVSAAANAAATGSDGYLSDADFPDIENVNSNSSKMKRKRRKRKSFRDRKSHLRVLMNEKRARVRYFNKMLGKQQRDGNNSNSITSAAVISPRQQQQQEQQQEQGHQQSKPISREGSNESLQLLAAQQRQLLHRTFSNDAMLLLSETEKQSVQKASDAMRQIQIRLNEFSANFSISFPIEVRLKNVNVTVPVDQAANKIRTVYNSSLLYNVVKFFKKHVSKTKQQEQRPLENQSNEMTSSAKSTRSTASTSSNRKPILQNINLVLKPGKMYLVLGPPGAGKSTFLRAIAGRLPQKQISGTVLYNGKSMADKTQFHIENAIAFIDQLDRHAPRLTVDETFEFAYQCKKGGTHMNFASAGSSINDSGHIGKNDDNHDDEERQLLVQTADQQRLLVNAILTSLGLSHVKDTFVGNDEVRGVSGGQRRRVTVGEMLMDSSPILCGDEISNGLDATSTYDMLQILMDVGRVQKMLRVFALLQPSPETVSLFDEIILLAEGQLLFAGPISEIEDYFGALGYHAPPHIDIADFLQLLSTPDAIKLYQPTEAEPDRTKPHTAVELAEIYQNSKMAKRIMRELRAPHLHVWDSARTDTTIPVIGSNNSNNNNNNISSAHHRRDNSYQSDNEQSYTLYLDDSRFKYRYANTFPRSTYLNLKRNLTIWIRDRRTIIANAAKNLIMGLSVGGVFFQTEDIVSILGVLFQGMLFVMLGAMTNAPGFVDERLIFYKLSDANFFSAFPFVLGKALSKLPQTAMDCVAFGTILYFMVGLASSAGAYFTFMSIIFGYSVLMNELLFIFACFCKTKALVQVSCACLVFFCILFCGFIIAPNVIPGYYTWIYWCNPLAWAYRALLVNEYRSFEYTDKEGDAALAFAGFVSGPNDKPFGPEWIPYYFLYSILFTIFCMTISSLCLIYIRPSMDINSGSKDDPMARLEDETKNSSTTSINNIETDVNISFKPATLTFEDICYDVKLPKSNDPLRLLHNVNGAFKSGRMCALMGSSGAGKTTLMDVIALRKTTGTISGEILVNGFPQEPITFRRCSGYVEQFDVQSPQLTIRETALFSARLRLDSRKVKTDKEKQRFVDQVLKTLELTPLADCLVGSDEEGGLSFEQRKRLSIAVELAASPSIIFLDEPTTGLDARSALLVCKLLRKIADQGRTVCATIHQPSSAVFDLFDDLLLLKKGGHVVYYGELGEESCELIQYFEKLGAAPIDHGENPANWMLRELQSETNPREFEKEYINSTEYAHLKLKLAEVKDNDTDRALKISYPSVFAVSSDLRQKLMNKRLQTIYWRSPAYNLSRLLVCIVIAFILASVFINNHKPKVFTEAQLRAWFSVTFLSFIIIGILSITSVLPVMLQIRDIFYRHRTAGMLDNISLGWALGTAEKWFIVLSSFLFCIVYIGVSGLHTGILKRSIRFWGIFTFNLAIYSYFGQAFMCCVPSMQTAQILASVFIGLNNFFSGLIVRPQFMTGFFQFPYWITPGHFVYEGLILAQFNGDERLVVATDESEFYYHLECDRTHLNPCNGTVSDYVESFFGGRFDSDHELQNILVLALFLVFARVLTFFALKHFNFSSN